MRQVPHVSITASLVLRARLYCQKRVEIDAVQTVVKPLVWFWTVIEYEKRVKTVMLSLARK